MTKLKIPHEWKLPVGAIVPANDDPMWLRCHPELWSRPLLIAYLRANSRFRTIYLKMVDDLCSAPAHIAKHRLAGLILKSIHDSCRERLWRNKERLEAESHQLFNQAWGVIRNITRNSMMKIKACNGKFAWIRPAWYGTRAHDVLWQGGEVNGAESA